MTIYKIKKIKINYLLVISILSFGEDEDKRKEKKKKMIEESKKMSR